MARMPPSKSGSGTQVLSENSNVMLQHRQGTASLLIPSSAPLLGCAFPPLLPSFTAGTLQLVEERKGDGVAVDRGGNVAERDGSTVRIKEGGGVFYGQSPLECVASHWPKLVAGAQSGELFHLEVE